MSSLLRDKAKQSFRKGKKQSDLESQEVAQSN